MKLRLTLALSLLSGLALAQAPLPPGAQGQMPPGHPPVDAPAAGADEPPAPQHGSGRQDSSIPSSELPRGVVEARILDGQGNPLPGINARLGILRQSVAEGDAKEFKSALTSPEGKVRFEGLEIGSKFGYRVMVKRDEAEYASDSFSLREDMGQVVTLHVYPVSSDIRKSMVGMRGFVMIEPRDDVFQFEVLFRVFNVGTTTWVPDDLVIDLPRGWKGFSAQDSMGDTRFAAEGDRGARLLGTFSPGQHDVAFRFQVPNDHEPTVDFKLGLPPHVAEMQVMAEAAKGMGFEASGMSPAQLSAREDGKRLLTTGRQLKPGEPEMQEVELRLTGIPTPGPGRWYAAGIAIVLGALGLFLATRDDKEKVSLTSLPEKDVARARKLLLDELVALERARKADEIGPKTYESARRALVDALARIEAAEPLRAARKTQRKRAKAH